MTCLIYIQTAILLTPAIIGVLTDPKLLADGRHPLAP
jgi:hypothetical protein